ncbi:ANK3, partial [Symbiodinium sp. KB8]
MEAADNAGDTPLHAAAVYCEVEAVRFLIQAGVNKTAVNKNGKTPADISACAYEQEVELLLQDEEAAQKPQPTATANTSPTATRVQLPAISVREAAEKGNVSALAAHRKAGANLSAELPGVFEEVGWTPAHYAAANNRSAALRYLLEAGANMEAADHLGNTPLHIAARYGRVGAARFLFQAGMNASAVNFEGKTPGHLVLWKSLEFLKAHITTTAAASSGSTSGYFE